MLAEAPWPKAIFAVTPQEVAMGVSDKAGWIERHKADQRNREEQERMPSQARVAHRLCPDTGGSCWAALRFNLIGELAVKSPAPGHARAGRSRSRNYGANPCFSS